MMSHISKRVFQAKNRKKLLYTCLQEIFPATTSDDLDYCTFLRFGNGEDMADWLGWERRS